MLVKTNEYTIMLFSPSGNAETVHFVTHLRALYESLGWVKTAKKDADFRPTLLGNDRR